jgi:cellulose synthase/poly-beta-1,6-N-acetylglucosamine synthase-like glycosyltransferase
LKISIVIPAFNEELLLGETLRWVHAAAEAFVRRGWESEVVVCNNNSTDRTAEIARAAGARVVFEPFNQIALALPPDAPPPPSGQRVLGAATRLPKQHATLLHPAGTDPVRLARRHGP